MVSHAQRVVTSKTAQCIRLTSMLVVVGKVSQKGRVLVMSARPFLWKLLNLTHSSGIIQIAFT